MSIKNLVRLAYENKTKEIINLLEHDNTIDLNQNTYFIMNVCDNNNMELLQYLLETVNLKNPIDIHAGHEMILCCSIYNKQGETNLEMLKYVLTSPNLKEHSNILYQVESEHTAFKFLFKLKKYEDSLVGIRYLTKEYAIEKKNAEIYSLLTKYSDDKDLSDEILENLIKAIEKTEDNDFKIVLQDKLKFLLMDNDYSENMIDKLMFEFAPKYKSLHIYDLMTQKRDLEQTSDYRKKLEDNFLNLLNHHQDDPVLIAQIKKNLQFINASLYEKYISHQKLNSELEVMTLGTYPKI